MKRWLLVFLAVFLLVGCSLTGKKDNYPYEPDSPAPAPHDGVFVSEHGSLRFYGDGERLSYDFDEELASWTGLPAGEQEGTYVFLSGSLPPHGSIPVRYDTAHELQITVGGQTAVIDLGIAADDGSSASSGVGIVTADSVPMLFHGDGFFSVVFRREGGLSVAHFFFTESNGSDYDLTTVYQLDVADGVCTAVIKPEGVKEEDALTVNPDADFAARLGTVLQEHDVGSWNGFNEQDSGIMDGIGFSLHIVLEDGAKIDATGYMEWPEHYNDAASAIHKLFLEIYEAGR